MISKRLFGSELLPQVQKKLEDRQKVAAEPAPGDSIHSHFEQDGNKLVDLSSRTPAIRMWTAVSLINPEIVAEILYEVPYEQIVPGQGQTLNDEEKKLNEEAAKQAKGEAFKFQADLNRTSQLTHIENPKGSGQWKYYIKEDLNERPEVPLATRIYTLGNNKLSGHGENPNESLGLTYDYTGPSSGQTGGGTGLTDEEKETVRGLFSQELKTNQFLKPAAGITSVTTETTELLGVIKKTTVNFEVHNFQDFDKIYNRYFMKPGATVFVDFGWSTYAGPESKFYNPKDLIDIDDKKNFLYGELDDPINNPSNIEGVITKAKGDFDVITGIVTDFSSKIQKNGSVQCTLNLTSANSALMSFMIDASRKRRIKNILDFAILYLAVYGQLETEVPWTFTNWTDRSGPPKPRYGGKADPSYDGTYIHAKTKETVYYRKSGAYDGRADANQFLIIPDAESSTDDITVFNNNLVQLALRLLGGQDLTPDSRHIRGGVYISSVDASDIYICWGLVEDLIINQNFGFGSDLKNISEGNNLNVRIDSSNSFTYWDEALLERQKVQQVSGEETPKFIIPEWWGGEDEQDIPDYEINKDKTFGSYNFQKGKYPIYPDDVETKDQYVYDKDSGQTRIPIREVFVNAEFIANKFDMNEDVKGALKDICNDINTDVGGVYKWELASGETDAELTIVDMNYVDIQNKINNAGKGHNNTNIVFEDLFTFDLTSNNSIITNYDIDFNLGDSDIGNMYAIQAMSHGSSILPLNQMIDRVISILSLDTDALSIKYNPDLTDFRASQIGAEANKDSSVANIYGVAKSMLDPKNGAYNINVPKYDILQKTPFDVERLQETDIIDQSLFHPLKRQNYYLENLQPKAKNTTMSKDEKRRERQRLETLRAESLGYHFAASFSDYFKYVLTEKLLSNNIPTILPIKLSLSLYGISSIQPGDVFKVNYLPNWYRDKVYFQTMKVTQELNSSGWVTTLDTQFRIRPDYKLNVEKIPRDKVILHPNALKDLDLKPGVKSFNKKIDANMNIATFPAANIFKYVREVKVAGGKGFVDMMIDFTWIATKGDILNSGGFKDPGDGTCRFAFPMEFKEKSTFYTPSKTATGGGPSSASGTLYAKSGFGSNVSNVQKISLHKGLQGWGILCHTEAFTEVILHPGHRYRMFISGQYWSIMHLAWEDGSTASPYQNAGFDRAKCQKAYEEQNPYKVKIYFGAQAGSIKEKIHVKSPNNYGMNGQYYYGTKHPGWHEYEGESYASGKGTREARAFRSYKGFYYQTHADYDRRSFTYPG